MYENEEPRQKRDKTKAQIKRRDKKAFFNNIVHELMQEDIRFDVRGQTEYQ